MKSGNFYITCKDQSGISYKLMNGWTEKVETPDGRSVLVGLNRISDRAWTVTELRSGRAVGIRGTTRAKCLQQLTGERLEKIAAAVDQLAVNGQLLPGVK